MLKKLFAAAGLLVVASPAFAALPVAIGTDIATTATDAATLGGLVLVLVVGIAVFKHLRSAK